MKKFFLCSFNKITGAAIAVLFFYANPLRAELPNDWKEDQKDLHHIETILDLEEAIFERRFYLASVLPPAYPTVTAYFYKMHSPFKTQDVWTKTFKEKIAQWGNTRKGTIVTFAASSKQTEMFPDNICVYAFSYSSGVFSEPQCFRLLIKTDGNNNVIAICCVVYAPSKINKAEPALFTILNNKWVREL